MLHRRGTDVPTLHRFAAADLGCGRWPDDSGR
jgi:hypothetical protein